MTTQSQQAAGVWADVIGSDRRHQGFFKQIGRTINKAKRRGVQLHDVTYSRAWRPHEVAQEVLARWTARKLARTTATVGGTSARGRL